MRPKMSLSRYLEVVSRLPMPTREQIEGFVAKIRKDHSWYKHLPILPPGRPIHFYLDPGAGMTRSVRQDGQLSAMPRTDSELLHYSWFSTAETVARFGYLCYTVVYPATPLFPPTAPALLDPRLGIDVDLPLEAFDAGRTDVSGLIHPLGARHAFIVMQCQNGVHPFPPETGGQAQAEKVVSHCRALVDGTTPLALAPQDAVIDDGMRQALHRSDWTLYQMLEPERRRQHDSMIEAASRAVAFAASADRR